MADLIEKYFHSELSEAEDAALAKRLESSEDEAQRFADKAEAAYSAFGLPEPRTESALERFFRSWAGKAFPPALVLGGLLVWYLWPKPEGPLPQAPVIGKVPVSSNWTSPPMPPTTGREPSTKAMVPARAPEVPTVSILRPAPPEPGAQPTSAYRNLNVIVNKESAGPVTVRILGPSGLEVRKLYEGPLQPGHWSFTWDGVLDDGLPAAAGHYGIEIVDGTGRRTQEVVIR